MRKKRAMSNSRDPEYTPEEDEAWNELFKRINGLSKEELERIERDSKKPKSTIHRRLDLPNNDLND